MFYFAFVYLHWISYFVFLKWFQFSDLIYYDSFILLSQFYFFLSSTLPLCLPQIIHSSLFIAPAKPSAAGGWFPLWHALSPASLSAGGAASPRSAHGAFLIVVPAWWTARSCTLTFVKVKGVSAPAPPTPPPRQFRRICSFFRFTNSKMTSSTPRSAEDREKLDRLQE